MRFLLSSEHEQLRDSLRRFLDGSFPQSETRSWLERDDGKRQTLKEKWREFSSLGLLLGCVNESAGGLGLGLLSAVIVVKEFGQTLAPLPVLETLLFGVLPARYGSDFSFLEGVMSGEKIVSGIVGDESVPEATQATVLTSEMEGVLSSVSFSLTANAPKPSTELIRELTPLGAIQILATERICELRESHSLPFERLLLVSAEMLGAARAVESLTLDYVRTRKQFGVSIGTFQAIQHKLADARLQLDATEALLHFSAWARENDEAQFPESALGAYVQCSYETKRAVEIFLQVHGGIGFTYDYDLHLFLRRILNLRGWFSSPSSAARALGRVAAVPSGN